MDTQEDTPNHTETQSSFPAQTAEEPIVLSELFPDAQRRPGCALRRSQHEKISQGISPDPKKERSLFEKTRRRENYF
jgi:hypothetical protein